MDVELTTGVRTYRRSEDGYFIINGRQSNFKISEFACKDEEKTDELLVDGELIEKLQIMREHFRSPIYINSGYRTEKHNAEVGGVAGSYHTKGKAADIVVSGVPSGTVANFARIIGFRGVGTYSTFTHVDTRETISYWNG